MDINFYSLTFQVLQVLASPFYFSTTKDFLCGCILLYCFRLFERRYGSTKFTVSVLLTSHHKICTTTKTKKMSSMRNCVSHMAAAKLLLSFFQCQIFATTVLAAGLQLCLLHFCGQGKIYIPTGP